MMRTLCRPSTQRGVTLVELLTGLALTATLLVLATPSLHNMVQLRRLDGAVQTYLSQMHWARLQAVALNQSVHVGFGQTLTGSCYAFYVGERDRCNCAAEPTCATGARLLLSVDLPQALGVAVVSGAKSVITLDALRGTVTPTFTATFSARNGHEVRATTSVMGRTRTCSPSSAASGWPACA